MRQAPAVARPSSSATTRSSGCCSSAARIPNWPEGADAPRGSALHSAAARRQPRAGRAAARPRRRSERIRRFVGQRDLGGEDARAARTAVVARRHARLLRPRLAGRGRRGRARVVTADPRAADAGCGGVFTAAATRGKRDLVVRLLDAGARVPPVLTACRSYLLENPEILRLLLASGMDPDLPNWQRATPLHDLCGRDGRGRAAPARARVRGHPARRRGRHLRQGRGIPLDAAGLGRPQRPARHGRAPARARRAHQPPGRRAVGDAARLGDAARARADRRDAARRRRHEVVARAVLQEFRRLGEPFRIGWSPVTSETQRMVGQPKSPYG